MDLQFVKPSQPLGISGLILLIGAHLFLDAVIALPGWIWSGSGLVVATAVPLSQVTLVAIFVAVVPMRPVLRFAIPVAAVFFGWYLLSQILPWGVSDSATAGWAIALAVQVTVVLAVTRAFKRKRHAQADEQLSIGELHKRNNPGRFGMGAVMLWTALVGCVFGFLRYGQKYWLWSAEVLEWDYLSVMPAIGITNGMLALVWFWAFYGTDRWWFLLRLLLAAITTGALVIMQFVIPKWFTGTTAITLNVSATLLVTQSVVVAISLLATKFLSQYPARNNLGLQTTSSI